MLLKTTKWIIALCTIVIASSLWPNNGDVIIDLVDPSNLPIRLIKRKKTMANTTNIPDLVKLKAMGTNNVNQTATLAQDINQGTYFVKPSGDDANAGKKTSPFKTINKAASIAQPGDTIIIYGGIYREQVNPINGGTGETHRSKFFTGPDLI